MVVPSNIKTPRIDEASHHESVSKWVRDFRDFILAEEKEILREDWPTLILFCIDFTSEAFCCRGGGGGGAGASGGLWFVVCCCCSLATKEEQSLPGH